MPFYIFSVNLCARITQGERQIDFLRAFLRPTLNSLKFFFALKSNFMYGNEVNLVLIHTQLLITTF